MTHLTEQDKIPLVIQILGFARAGKDFTAAQLKAYYESIGKSVKIISYAASMKQMTATLFDITLKRLDEYKNNTDRYRVGTLDYYQDAFPVGELINFRTILQRMGNEVIKPIFGDNVWAHIAQQTINKTTADIIIIPDCRFQVELQTIGGITVRVINTALPIPSQHASELELADTICMYTLDNTNYQATEQNIAQLAKRILNES